MQRIELGGRVPTLFGVGAAGRLPETLAGVGLPTGPVLVVADGGLKPFGHVDRLAESLARSGCPAIVYDSIAGEPKESQVEAALELGRSHGAEIVVCLGGGSALDAGKITAALMRDEGRPLSDYRLAAVPLPTTGVPAICLPTTAGTGSEVTPISILSAADGTKFWYWGDPLFARLAVLDPELTTALPPRFTAMTGMDALVHAMEAATNRNAAPDSDQAALRAIHLATRHLATAVRDGANIAARAGMLEAAALGGVAIAKAGTALAHNIGHALGSLAPVPHGLAVTLAMAATAEWVVEGNRPGFERVAEAMGLGPNADRVPEAFRRLAIEIDLPLDTAAAAPGLTGELLARQMAAPENASMRKSTARSVRDEDLLPLAEVTLALSSQVRAP